MERNNRTVEDIELESISVKRPGIILQRRVGNLLYLSGHGPEDQVTHIPIFRGRVGEDLTLEQGYAAARECAIILLSAAKDILGNLDKVKRVVRALGLVNCGEGFTQVNQVMDGFSNTMMEVLEERGYHARTVMGTRNMPNHNIPVEIEVILQVEG